MGEFGEIIVLSNKMEPSDYCQNVILDDDKHLLIIFQTEIEFSYDGKIFINVPANTAIIYSPGTLNCYKAKGAGLLNSFMYFYPDKTFFNRYNIPLNTLIPLEKESCEKIVFDLDRITYIVNTPYAQSMKPKIPEWCNNVFKQINTECLAIKSQVNTSSMRTSFMNVRSLMYSNPSEYTVKKMAELIGFTETYFGIKYQEFFKIKPSQDRKNKIVEGVKEYLRETDYSLECICDKFNIKSVAHIINLFKSVTGMTPHQYRIEQRKNNL